ncbi:MAG: YggS family pyridoxal phosphate-dependent enzyme [Candidatus Didemnitutus sp.]|nr:YggS family pyridoxal phosphate-dependent enzyme [Candidatus Didemnitutus sp.]
MFIEFETFRNRADKLRALMDKACRAAGRDPAEVTLMPVTKNHPAAAAAYVARYGLGAVAENRVQEAIEKRGAAPAALRWELIGHLQSNKAKLAATHFDRVQSVDSPKLAERLNRAAGELGKQLPILLQVNAGNDPAKFGAEPSETPHLLEIALAQPHLRVDGLMTIAPLGETPAETTAHARRTFSNLRKLRDELQARFRISLPELSMGMTGDFTEAIAEGSTMVRVGTALFGSRD